MNKITDFGIELKNGIKVEHYHEQDCCENVYADWMQLKDTTFENEKIEDVEIEMIKDSGFRINGYFVPYYNSQNGYYGSDLMLVIRYPNGIKKEIDITECNQDDIDD